MAFDDTGMWNIVSIANGAGNPTVAISAIQPALQPTGAETQVQAWYNGEQLDWGILRFYVK